MNGKRILSLIIAAILMLSVLSSCSGSINVSIHEMSVEDLEECISLCQYKDLELTLGAKGKEAVLLSYLDANSSVKKYPKGTVDYYFEQLKAQYRYYADEADMRYEAMLDELGEDNVTMKAEARRLVKRDLILELIREREGITLTDAEKTQFFDKYVQKYAESYKYSEEYVRSNLSSLVYDSMLYDKTIEFLIIHNSFVGDIEDDNSSNSDDRNIEIKVSENDALLLSEDVNFSNLSKSLAMEKISITNISASDIPDEIDFVGGINNESGYFAYTFYLKNNGTEMMDICSEFAITSAEGNIAEAIRVRMYREGADAGAIYARLAQDGSPEYNTTAFLSDDKAFSLVEENVEAGKAIKYTLVVWLEGDDPECVDSIMHDSIDMLLSFSVKK